MARAVSVRIGVTAAAPVGSVVSRWSGALRATGFTAVAKTSGASSVRLAASTSSGMSSPTYSKTVTPDAQGMVKATVNGLTPNTQYWYAWELGGGLDLTKLGKAKTAPVGASSFIFAFASCDNGSGVADTYSRAKARGPLFWVAQGDFYYGDITSNTPASFRGFYDTMLGASGSGPFFADVPIAYTWSDHDFADNNSVGTSGTGATVKPAAQAVYRQYVPHYELLEDQNSGGIYQTFVIGRVRFIVTDNRTYKSLQTNTDNSSKTVLGVTQKQWWKDLIANSVEPLIFWVDDQPWSNFSAADDEWPNYNTERTELDTFVRGTGKKVVILAGDMHALGYDSSVNGPGGSGGMPVCQAAPVDNNASLKVDAMSGGVYPTSGSTVVRQYGLITVTDNGSTSLDWAFTGYDTSDVSRVTGAGSYGSLTAPAQPSGPGGSWTLAFADEFTGSALSSANWRSGALPWGDLWISTHPEEVEWYDPAAVTVSAGTMKITATQQTHPTFTTQLYRSGMVHTQKRFDFVYGFAEARLKLPTGAGCWPAFWTAPTDESWPPEIDIMEAYWDNVTQYEANFHYDPGAAQAGPHAVTCDISTFHVYGVRWTPTQLTYYLDGTSVWTVTTGVPSAQNVPAYLLLNLAISSNGNPGSGSWPQVYEVDYVRVWEGG